MKSPLSLFDFLFKDLHMIFLLHNSIKVLSVTYIHLYLLPIKKIPLSRNVLYLQVQYLMHDMDSEAVSVILGYGPSGRQERSSKYFILQPIKLSTLFSFNIQRSCACARQQAGSRQVEQLHSYL
jgi:hypothetical protein